MLDKLRIALVLFVIGSLSGLSIVGVHRITEERIAENRLQKQYEAYMDIFPDMDINNMDIEEIEDDIIHERITARDNDGNVLGFIFVGQAQGFNAPNTVLLGVDANGVVVQVVISATDDTPNYVNNIRENYLPNLKGQQIFEMSYDANTGATGTYNSVRTVIQAATQFVEGDPLLDEFRSIFASAESYATVFDFEGEPMASEIVIRDAAGVIIGYAYDAEIDEETIYLLVDHEDNFKGFLGELAATDDFDGYIDTLITDIELNGEDAALGAVIEAVQVLVDSYERIDREYLVRYQPVMSGDDIVAYRYIGYAQGFSGMNVIEVIIDLDGIITEFEILRTNDTPDYVGDAENIAKDNYVGESDISDMDDIFAGVTRSGTSIINVVDAAIQYHSEREDE